MRLDVVGHLRERLPSSVGDNLGVGLVHCSGLPVHLDPSCHLVVLAAERKISSRRKQLPERTDRNVPLSRPVLTDISELGDGSMRKAGESEVQVGEGGLSDDEPWSAVAFAVANGDRDSHELLSERCEARRIRSLTIEEAERAAVTSTYSFELERELWQIGEGEEVQLFAER